MQKNKILQIAGLLVVVIFAVLIAFTPVFKPNELLNKYLPLVKNINLGLDLRGGVHVVIEAKGPPEEITPEKMKQLRAVIERRVDQFGVSEPVIQQQGSRRLIVELAGIKDPDEAVRNIVKVANLEFKTENGKTVITGADLKDARETKDPASNQVKVDLTFTPTGSRKFAEVTTANVGKTIGIYLDGRLLQNPVVKEAIPSGRAEISGYESLEEAHNIAILLRSGALPVKVGIEEMRTVGPSLGSDSLNKSQQAGLMGIIAILIFMLIYYRLPGTVAVFALIIYAIIVTLVFLGLKATMTLPGIAAFLLSLGMAVDTNIIIFERFKEELRTGKSLRAAIDAGFKRGFTAVFDAQVTTLIAAVVLYFFGTGPVRGFALTLGIGILVSLFTAVTMTRWFLRLMVDSGLFKSLKYYGT
ncbi:MAG: hypothetical protein STSR0004_16930 [Peptococcaceae bacterium]